MKKISKSMPDSQMKVDLRKVEDEHALGSVLHTTFSAHHIIKKMDDKN